MTSSSVSVVKYHSAREKICFQKFHTASVLKMEARGLFESLVDLPV